MVGRIENLELQEVYFPRFRKVNGLTIYFKTKQSIYVTDGKVAIVLERWFEGNAFYRKKWKNMVYTLTYNKSIKTVYDVWNIAMRYEVNRHQTFRFPEIEPGTAEITNTKERKK